MRRDIEYENIMLWTRHKDPSRREQRLALTETTEFERRGGLIFGCRIVNCSHNGMCISVGVQLHPGEIIKLATPTCYARVMWYRENKAGLKFVGRPDTPPIDCR